MIVAQTFNITSTNYLDLDQAIARKFQIRVIS